MSDWVFCVVDMTRESLVPVNTDMLDRVTYIRFWLLDQYLYYPFKETGDDQRRLFRTPQSDKSKTYNSHLDVLKYVISISTLKLKLLRPWYNLIMTVLVPCRTLIRQDSTPNSYVYPLLKEEDRVINTTLCIYCRRSKVGGTFWNGIVCVRGVSHGLVVFPRSFN